MIQTEFLQNIKYAAKKLGLLGLNVVTVKRLPREQGESDKRHRERNQKHMAEVAKSITENYSKGVLVLPEEQTHNNHAISNDVRGAKELFNLVEEQLISGLNSHPALHGRPNSTTESYARVIYNLLLNNIANTRRLVKRVHEDTLRLDLMLAGIQVDHLSVQFNKDAKLKPNVEALARQYEVNNTIKEVMHGIISPDEGAQRLGYPTWYDEKLLEEKIKKENAAAAEFVFDRASQQYRLVRHTLDLDRVKQVGLKDERKDDEKSAVKAAEKLGQLAAEYLADILPYYNDLGPAAQEWALQYMADHFDEVKKDNGKFIGALIDYLRENHFENIQENQDFRKAVETRIIDAAKYYRENDLSVFGANPPGITFKFGEGDRKAADMVRDCDYIFLSQFISNQDFGTEVKEFLTSFFERGEAGHGAWTKEAQDEFLRLFGSALKGDIYRQINRIVTSSTGMIQVNSRFKQMFEAGVVKAKVISRPGCCTRCAFMDGKEIPVKTVWEKIEKGFVNAGSAQEALDYIKATNIQAGDKDLSIEELVEKGRGWPKYHPHCRCIIRAIIEALT